MTKQPTKASDNATRADRCDTTLRRYPTDHPHISHLIGLLADARHWCDREG